MDKKNLAFDKMNFILLGIGMAIIIIGFLLMSGMPVLTSIPLILIFSVPVASL